VKGLFTSIKADGCKLVLACADDEIDRYKAIAGISDMTDHDVTAGDAGSSKPSPDIFLQTLDLLAPIGPSQTCVVGDTKYDGEAARRAGVPFLGLLCGGSSKDELERSGAVAIYRDPAELLSHWGHWRELSSNPEFSAA
jgi:phosphoglycolate phosphatase-like HAD superfamily hydrolase